MMRVVSFCALFSSAVALKSFVSSPSSSKSRLHAETPTKKPGKGVAFNYDSSNYKDSNSGNYRRLTDQLNAAKAEEEQLRKEREELIRKEQMAQMFIKKENDTFWNTPPDTIVATSDKYFVPPEVLQIIDDLDNQLIGLSSVSAVTSKLDTVRCDVDHCDKYSKDITLSRIGFPFVLAFLAAYHMIEVFSFILIDVFCVRSRRRCVDMPHSC
jgi:hypothetical protein